MFIRTPVRAFPLSFLRASRFGAMICLFGLPPFPLSSPPFLSPSKDIFKNSSASHRCPTRISFTAVLSEAQGWGCKLVPFPSWLCHSRIGDRGQATWCSELRAMTLLPPRLRLMRPWDERAWHTAGPRECGCPSRRLLSFPHLRN